MADKKISELDQVLQINNDAAFPMSQDSGGTPTTYKASITQLGAEIGEEQTFSNLQTTSKNLVGAINELNQGGGGSGGHTILDDDGTSLTQRSDLQFKGAYSTDNSTDGITEVNVVRSMTKAQYNQLSADEKVGLIEITDEDSITANEMPIQSGSATDTKTYIDNGLSEKQDSLTYESDDYNVATYGGVIRCKKWGRLVNIQGFGIGSSTALPSNAATTLCTIASKYRPNPQQHVAGINSASGYKYDGTQFYRINTDGTVVTYAYTSPTINNGYFNVTYMV